MSNVVMEETRTVRTAPNGLKAWINATYRDRDALTQHSDFFDSLEHNLRVDRVYDILQAFFKRDVDYETARGLNRNLAFTAVKMDSVGNYLSKIGKQTKWNTLYAPLFALGDVDVLSTNGHLIVRVYPVGKMPAKPSVKSVRNWYPATV